MPELVAALPRLEHTASVRLADQLRNRHRGLSPAEPVPEAWFEWNLRRAQARRALRSLPPP
jgi:hypothetical protein